MLQDILKEKMVRGTLVTFVRKMQIIRKRNFFIKFGMKKFSCHFLVQRFVFQ